MGGFKTKCSQHALFCVATNILVLRKLTKASRAIGTVDMTLQEKVEARASVLGAQSRCLGCSSWRGLSLPTHIPSTLSAVSRGA